MIFNEHLFLTHILWALTLKGATLDTLVHKIVFCLFTTLFFKENELKRAKLITEETEQKYEEVVRKIAVLERELEETEERAEGYQKRLNITEQDNIRLVTSK